MQYKRINKETGNEYIGTFTPAQFESVCCYEIKNQLNGAIRLIIKWNAMQPKYWHYELISEPPKDEPKEYFVMGYEDDKLIPMSSKTFTKEQATIYRDSCGKAWKPFIVKKV